MRYGFVIPGGDVHDVVKLACEAESAGWDGVFIPDCIYIDAGSDALPLGFDPWVVLAAIAVRTERVRIGPMLTPISRRRPWKLARETVTLDHLSNGRLILSVGLGALDDGGFGKVGEITDRKARARMLDEGLAILDGLWSGRPFSFTGEYYHVEEMTFLPSPVQSPRIPIWVVGVWPRTKSMQRALQWDGLLPARQDDHGSFSELTPDDIRQMKVYIEGPRSSTLPYDIVVEGATPGEDHEKAQSIVRSWADAGATWWLEAMWSPPDGLNSVRARINQGPPRIG